MEPWYKVATPRRRSSRRVAIASIRMSLPSPLSRSLPGQRRRTIRDPEQFFARTCFTGALREHSGMVLRRLAVGKSENTSPVLTLITQFGGGKTHTLTTLYHLTKNGDAVLGCDGVADLVRESGIASLPTAKVAVFVGNAWDPQEGRETPWIDVARQLAGDSGVESSGSDSKDHRSRHRCDRPGIPGCRALHLLLLFDEVLNYLNRHRGGADSFLSFIQNLTVATTGTYRTVRA